MPEPCGFTVVDNELLDRHAPEIGPAPVALYLLLRRLAIPQAGTDGAALVVVGYSHQELAEQLGSSRRAVMSYLKTLEKNGLVTIQSRDKTGRGYRSGYLVSEPRESYSALPVK